MAHSRTDNIPARQLLVATFEGTRRLKCRASKKMLDKGYPHRSSFIKMARETGFEFNKRFIWDKCRIGMGYNGRNRYEQIIFLSKGKRRMPLDLSIPDVLSHKMVPPHKRVHDAQKPIELIKDILQFCSAQGDVILDPFAGSLSLVHAGLDLDRHTISIEIDPNAIKRAISQNSSMTLTAFT